MTVPEASEVLKLSDQTIWRYIKDGKLPGRKVGRQYLIPVDAVEAMLEPKAPEAPQGATAHE